MSLAKYSGSLTSVGNLLTGMSPTVPKYVLAGVSTVPAPAEKLMIKQRREQRRAVRQMHLLQKMHQASLRLNRPSEKSRAIMKRTLEIANERV